MNGLTVFKNDNFGEVRTIIQDGEPWWVLTDVCRAIDLTNPTEVAKRLDSDEVTKFNLGGLSGESNVVNESGLYSVILRSDKSEAKKFKRWITHDVIPQIRKTGSYSLAQKNLKEALYLAYKQQEQIEELEKTKAWISDKKTATAMNTASQMSKKASKLAVQLDLAMAYATIKKVEMASGRKYDWRELKNYCKSAGLGWNKAFDVNYGEVNSYPAEAWQNVYGVNL